MMQRSAAATLGACLAAWALCASSSQAASLTTFGSLAGFQSATGASSATGALPWAGALGSFSAPLTSSTIGSVTIDAPRWFLTNWSTLLPGGEIAVSDGSGSVGGVANDGINASFAAPVFAAGFDFHEPTGPGVVDGCNVSPCVNSQFEVRVLNGGTLLAALPWNPPKDQRTFFGVWSDTAFTRLEIRELVGTDDNELYGEFYTGTLAAPVPEPAGWLLGATGLLVLRRVRRSRSR